VYEGDRLLGLAWRACPNRRDVVLGGQDVAGGAPVYYHPVPAPGRTIAEVVRALRGIEAAHPELVVVAQDGDLGATPAEAVGRFAADLRFRPRRALAAPRPRPR
jgi:hypothetical protein